MLLKHIRAAYEAAKAEDEAANASGTAASDDALALAYTALPVMNDLLACVGFLADALPAVEAYAASLTDPIFRQMWESQIEKYKTALSVFLPRPTGSQPETA